MTSFGSSPITDRALVQPSVAIAVLASAAPIPELTTALATLSCKLLHAISPNDVLQTLQDANGGLVIIDLRTTESTYLELINAVRTRWHADCAPMLVLTDTTRTELRDAALDAGANDYLDAPFDARMLSRRISQLLQLLQLTRTNTQIQANLEQQISTRTKKLDMLIENGLMLSMARSRAALFRHTLVEGKRLLNCEGGTMYLVTPEKTLRFSERTREDFLPMQEIPLFDAVTGKANLGFVSVCAAINKQTILIDDVYADSPFNLSGTRDFDARSGYHTVSLMTVPMAPRNGEVIGVLQFMNAIDPVTGAIVPFSPDIITLIEALAAQASVALDNLQLVDAQKAMMESMIQVLATAIDAKSPYTGEHCERVPELSMMLAHAASETKTGPLADFTFSSEEEWYEFRVGAWLHDCGKITSPEHVIDKATKLETIYNRLHEIRTRFEVLLRDAMIAQQQAIISGVDKAAAATAFELQKASLIDDFAFIAKCNVGGETMSADDLSRLQRIAEHTWLRHFDDRIGLSHSEEQCCLNEPIAALPATEFLLSDKLRHQIPRPSVSIPDPSFGFNMVVPALLYNLGEKYNLAVARGTLTTEERYKINEHMVHGIMMLEQMNFPKSLRRVPEYAGTHHETLSGKGYPRGLSAAELSIPARIVAIADIFEALSACDRPYKTPKLLSEVLAIMHQMRCHGHIDSDLFDLLLQSGVYLRYAEQHMLPTQRDAVDLTTLTHVA